jgi:Flp pilus assembly protein TadD
MLLAAEAYLPAYGSFRRAVELDPLFARALRGSSDAAAGAQLHGEHRAWLQSLTLAAQPRAAVLTELSRVLAAVGEFDLAIASASEARRLEPANPSAAEQLASVFADLGELDRLKPLVEMLIGRFPDRDDSRYYYAVALFMEGRVSEAADHADQLLRSNPGYAKAQNLLGTACAALKRVDCARQALEASIRLDPRDPTAHINLGLFYLESANVAGAAAAFAEALALDPSSQAAREGLAKTRIPRERS